MIRRLCGILEKWMFEDDSIIFTMVKLFGMIFLITGLIAAPFAYMDAHEPNFTLKKAEWHCTASHPETTTTYVMSGKIAIPITTTNTVCNQWTENGFGGEYGESREH